MDNRMGKLGGDKHYGGKEDNTMAQTRNIHLIYEKAGDSRHLVLMVYQEHYERTSCQQHTILTKIDLQLWEAVYFQ